MLEGSFDGSFTFAHDDSSCASPLRIHPSLPASPQKLVEHPGGISAVNEEEESEGVIIINEDERKGDVADDDYPVPAAWGDEPTPEQLQQIQDRVSAWLHTSRPSPTPTPTSGLRFPSSIETSVALHEVPEEDDADEDNVEPPVLAPRVQPLRMLDSISEDEPPPFAGSSVSTAPSTPLPLAALPQLARSRSQSPPLRRRSLEAQEEYYPRGLDTIQEAGPAPISMPSPRRSLDSAKRPSSVVLESIPEIDIPPSVSASTPKRKLGIKGFGFARSESEPLMPSLRSVPFIPSGTGATSNLGGSLYSSANKRMAPAAFPNSVAVGATAAAGAKGSKSVGRLGTVSSPTLPSFQRGASAVMGQRPTNDKNVKSFGSITSEPRTRARKPLNPPMYSLGAIANETSLIEDDESRRLTEAAFLG